jgi:hypothetical protein
VKDQEVLQTAKKERRGKDSNQRYLHLPTLYHSTTTARGNPLQKMTYTSSCISFIPFFSLTAAP